MTRKRKRAVQVTCECSAYDFPHRIGGGECNGCAWVASFKIIDNSLCDSCNCFSNNECQAATGQESFKAGDCFEDELRSQAVKDKYGNLPKTEEQVFEINYKRFHDD